MVMVGGEGLERGGVGEEKVSAADTEAEEVEFA